MCKGQVAGRWRVRKGWVEMGQTMRGLGGLARGLGFLMGALGSQGRVLSREEEQTCNLTELLWLPCGGEGGGRGCRRLTAGD